MIMSMAFWKEQSLLLGNLVWLGLLLAGCASPRPAGVAFSNLPPIWRRQWFITVVVVLIAAALIAFDRYRAARLKQLNGALTESRNLTKELTAQRADLRRANQVLELEYAITRILSEAPSPVDAMPHMLRVICEAMGWQTGAVWNVDRQTHVLHCAEIWHSLGMEALTFEQVSRQQVFMPGEGLPGQVLESGEAHWVTDVAAADNLPRTAATAKEKLCSAFGFPVLLRGEVIGILEFLSRERREPEAELIKMMATIGSDIGQLIERKRAEEALRESETRFRTLAETASDAILTIDASGTIVFVNPAAENVFGYSLAELIGEDLTILMPEYLRHVHQASFARYRQTESSTSAGRLSSCRDSTVTAARFRSKSRSANSAVTTSVISPVSRAMSSNASVPRKRCGSAAKSGWRNSNGCDGGSPQICTTTSDRLSRRFRSSAK
jgi:PAS domain S-box-containing protein